MLFFLLICVVFVFVLYVQNQHKFWKNRSVPGPKPSFLFGNLKNFILGKEHLAITFDDIYKSFPSDKYVGFYEFFKPNLLIRDPELVEHIFVKDFSYFQDRIIKLKHVHRLGHHLPNLTDTRWKSVRSKLVPTFSTNKLKLMYHLIEHCCEILNSHVRIYASTDEPIDVKEVMAKFATDVIGSCAFGLEFNSLKNPDSEYRKIGQRLFTLTPKNLIVMIIRFINPKLIAWLKISEIPGEIETFFFNLLRETEEFRKNEPNKRNDFMQLMLDIRDQELSFAKTGDNQQVLFNDDILASNMFVFYLAGFETTATTLCYCLYELALNLKIQENVRKEINDVLNIHGGVMTYDALNELVYTDMVISETLRKHNPAPFTARVCTKTYQVPGTSLVIKPGDRVTVPIHSIHHDENYYPNPSKFDPERFSEENKVHLKPYTYLPFGDGPRICIGLRFAKVEMKACLSSLLRKYKFTPCDRTEIPIQIKPRSILYSAKNEIFLQISEI